VPGRMDNFDLSSRYRTACGFLINVCRC